MKTAGFLSIAAAVLLLSPLPGRAGATEANAALAIPAAVAVPPGATLVERFHATGAQVYGCAAANGAYAWTLKRPDATLFDAANAEAGKHGAGPSWTAKDGSSVTGAKLAQADAPLPDAVPWLLLKATSTAGHGRLGTVTFIQRLATKGGKAPATGCDAAHAGAELRVGYSADYYFYTGGAAKSAAH
jgi:hypothetical protein